MILQLAYFLFVTLGMGYAAWKLLGLKEEDGYAALFLYAGTGLALFVQASTVLGFIGFAYWYVYAAIAAIMLAAVLRKGMPRMALPKFEKGWGIVCLLFLIHFYVYFTGSTAYPWLEDDDPWDHASATRYISLYGTYIQPEPRLIHYLAPYPPFFDVLLSTLFGIDGSSLQLTLKFFNALLVSLSVPFFYCWLKRRTDGRAALWATAILAMLPSFMSHFIWAQTLAMILVFPSLYFIDRFFEQKEGQKQAYGAMAVLSLGALLVTQPSVAGIIFLMVLFYVGVTALIAAIKKELGPAAAIKEAAAIPTMALLMALLLFWGPMFILFGVEGVLSQLGLGLGFITGGTTDDTSGGVVYGVSDFLVAPSASKMDQPVGWGLFVTILAAAGLVLAAYRIRKGEERAFNIVLLLWLVFCFIGVEGNAMPFKMMPHRFWVFLALPVSILAGSGAAGVLGYAEEKRKGIAGVLTAVLLFGLLITSAAPKYEVETSMWPPGVGWVSNEQIAGYVKLKELPANTKVFSFCGEEEHANGMDLFGYAWSGDVKGYKARSISDNVDGNYAFLKNYSYEYAVIDQSCLVYNQPETIQAKLNALASDQRFAAHLSGNAFIVFKVN